MKTESRPDLNQEPDLRIEMANDVCADFEAISRLRRLPPGPWRSRGEYLDYTNWSDRDRFIELDRAIEDMPLTMPHVEKTFNRTRRARRRRMAESSNRISWETLLTEIRRVSGQ